MTDISQINFDTEELLNNVNIIIQSGLNKLVKDFVEKHKIYEETHKGVLNLPSVKKMLSLNKELNVISDSDSESDSENNEGPPIFVSIKEMTEDLVDEKIKILEQTMINSFQVFTSTNSMISQKMLSHIESLNNELRELKQTIQNMKPPLVDLTHDSEELQVQMEIKQIVDEVVIKGEIKEIKEEKENIVLQIVEDEVESDDEESDEDSDDEVSEEAQADAAEESEEETHEELEEPEEESEEAEEELEEADEELEEAEEESEEPEEESEEAEEESEEEAVVEEKVLEPQVTTNQDIETEEEAEESESDDEHEEEKEHEEEDDDDNELFEIEIEDVTYCTNDEENGIIYELTEEGEAGKKVGFLKDGEATFY